MPKVSQAESGRVGNRTKDSIPCYFLEGEWPARESRMRSVPGCTGALGRWWWFPPVPTPGFSSLRTLSLVGVVFSGQSNPQLSAWEGSADAPSTALLAPRQMDGIQSA